MRALEFITDSKKINPSKRLEEGEVVKFTPRKSSHEKYSDAFSKQHNDEHRYGVGHIPCDYCGEVSCDYDCDGSQADGELDEGWKEKAAAGLVGLGLMGTPTPTTNVAPSIPSHPQVAPPTRALTKVETLIKDTAKKAGIKGHELAQLLAHTAHETGDFVAMEELGGNKYLMHKYWNNIPVRTRLGNKHPADAIKYKGRGYIQLTGRGNYAKMGEILGIDLINHPKLAAKPDVAARIAVQYFKNRVEPSNPDYTNTTTVTKKINSHDKPAATQDRDTRYRQYKNLLGLL